MYEKGFYAGVESAPGPSDFIPSEVGSTYSPVTSNDGETIATIVQTAVAQALEARDNNSATGDLATNNKNRRHQPNMKLTVKEQPCKHCRKIGKESCHPNVEEAECFMNPDKTGFRPPWAVKKQNEAKIKIRQGDNKE